MTDAREASQRCRERRWLVGCGVAVGRCSCSVSPSLFPTPSLALCDPRTWHPQYPEPGGNHDTYAGKGVELFLSRRKSAYVICI